jgi:hypothetical protein
MTPRRPSAKSPARMKRADHARLMGVRYIATIFVASAIWSRNDTPATHRLRPGI